MNSGIYLIRNRANGKEYVGKSKNLKGRWSTHKSQLRSKKHVNLHLQKAWTLYGESSFSCEILEYCVIGDLVRREKWWMDLLGLRDPTKGYNINDPEDGFLGHKHTPETKSKISSALQGRKQVPEAVARRSASNTGKKRTPEVRAILSKQKIGYRNPMKNQECVAKMSTTKAGCYEVITPEAELFTIRNMSKFCRDKGLNKGHMCSVARGEMTHYKGWKARKIGEK